jgi:large subunit ribosomal protein L19
MNQLLTDINFSKKEISFNYLKYIEQKTLEKTTKKPEIESNLEVGDIIRIGYLIPEGQKDRTQHYEGLIIAQNNRGLGKSITLRRSVQGIGLEQVFLLHSPKIVSIIKKQSSKVRRSKLYFIRNLRGKSARLKRKM